MLLNWAASSHNTLHKVIFAARQRLKKKKKNRSLGKRNEEIIDQKYQKKYHAGRCTTVAYIDGSTYFMCKCWNPIFKKWSSMLSNWLNYCRVESQKLLWWILIKEKIKEAFCQLQNWWIFLNDIHLISLSNSLNTKSLNVDSSVNIIVVTQPRSLLRLLFSLELPSLASRPFSSSFLEMTSDTRSSPSAPCSSCCWEAWALGYSFPNPSDVGSSWALLGTPSCCSASIWDE